MVLNPCMFMVLRQWYKLLFSNCEGVSSSFCIDVSLLGIPHVSNWNGQFLPRSMVLKLLKGAHYRESTVHVNSIWAFAKAECSCKNAVHSPTHPGSWNGGTQFQVLGTHWCAWPQVVSHWSLISSSQLLRSYSVCIRTSNFGWNHFAGKPLCFPWNPLPLKELCIWDKAWKIQADHEIISA